MIRALERAEQRLETLRLRLSDVDFPKNGPDYVKAVREASDLEPIVEKGLALRQSEKRLAEAKVMAAEAGGDPELRQMAEDEVKSEEARRDALFEELRLMLTPKDPDDDKNAIVEIRAGTGGEEAALFASDLLRMYTRFADRKGWTAEVAEISETGIGGLKEVVFMVSGAGVFGSLKYEAGTHRVQRVPATEASGRIHTSAVTVAVLPEAEELDFTIREADLRIDTYRSGGAGGQHVNKTDSAVRITHVPTGVVVACQDERSQLKNKNKAMRLLRSRLAEAEKARAGAERSAERREQVGSGDRSEKIRTYNFPQNRVTDHRIDKTLHHLSGFLDGDMGDVIDALILDEKQRRLAQATGR